MAYAAPLSLSQILEQLSNPHLEQHQTPLQDQQIKSLQEKLSFLLDFLDDSWQMRNEEVRCLEREIRDAAYKAEDIIESHISKNFGQKGFQERQVSDQTFCENFEIVADEIDSIKTNAAKLNESWGSTYLHQSKRNLLPIGQSRVDSSGKSAMVGFRDDLNQIVDQLTGHPPSRKVIPIIGMGGIGKTTLARNVYNDPRIKEHFHIRAWASISQENREREVLLSLLNSMEQLSVEILQEEDTGKLKERLYKSLNGRSYLVVMDDIWTTKAWDSLSKIFPNDRNGSRIILTTRLLSAVDSHGSPHHMQFLDETNSWILLRRKVFGEDSCPRELEEAGKEIAKNCKGLPLSLVVIGGHLSKANRTKDHWDYVAENVKSVVTSADANCSEILSLSYEYLPHYLKACFIYVGVFPEDDRIHVSKLIKLWVAEGFLKPVKGKTLEEVAEEYLGDLISRNLILISQRSSSGKIKTCSIHDMLRDLCIRKAQEEKFFHVTVTDKDFRIFAEGIKYSRRLCIHQDIFHKELSNSDTSKGNPSMGSLPTVRSILCSCSASKIFESGDRNLFPLLRVLDHGKGKLDGFPIGETKLVHARYLSFSHDGKISVPKILPCFLWYLQTLIVDCKEVHLPEEIWRMPHLRHLLFGKCYIPCPARSQIDGKNLALGNLLTFSKVSSSSCIKEVFERVPNLKKLGILDEHLKVSPFSLGTLVNLHQLENLKIRSEYECISIPMNFTFPPNIKKLTLEYCRIPWKHMTIVGSMANLEVLKLRYKAFDGPEWKPTEGEFRKLKCLLLLRIDLVQWRADDTHFPVLERLYIRECYKLEEIPCSIGDIPTLQIIDLDDNSPSAVTSAKIILEEQKNWGNDSLQVHVNCAIEEIHRSRKIMEDEILGSNDDTLLLKDTALFGKFLSMDQILLPDGIITAVVPRLFEFLGRDDYPQLQCEAATAIASISTRLTNHINILIDHGAIPIFVRLVSSPKDVLRKQALEVLGNIARDSTQSRDLVLSHGVLMSLLAQFNDKTELSIMRKVTQILSKIFRTKPLPHFEQVKSAIPLLAHLIHTDDKEVLMFVCLTLINLTDGTQDIIQAVIDAGVIPRLVELFLHPSPSVLYPALQTLYNIISNGDDIQIQVITDNGALPFLCDLLTTPNSEQHVKKGTCSMIGKLIQRSKDHIQAVIEAGIISPLVQLLQNAEFELQRVAALAILSAIEGTNEQIKFLVHEGCIKPMCDLLASPHHVIIIILCLLGLGNILKVGEAEKNQGNTEDVNVFAQMIDDAGGLKKIKNLRTHYDSTIRKIVKKKLVLYWYEEDDNDEDEDENIEAL
ncbi:late blight resistance homolog R1A-3 isoform X1 [Olea europaea subsp. europaea]|uniref:Late blight resistance homolog R1A-3 isoform X1 n=1 Tax=Olea europaea subsp. europaea TaxID=158383 RepID=A0A8S0QTD9_OLEEU|nr:late blight resistance homolog R1A-3 isoform X1 [Olea europaea subsp. europaea]